MDDKSEEASLNSGQKRNVVFFHPDLGIGGAERLVVDAAIGLQELGHKVTIFTSHCDKSHCFEEVRDGTLDVRVRGNGIFPSTLLNRFHILLATLRQIHLVLRVSYFTSELRTLMPDIFIVDQLSACVPLLRWLWPRHPRILFYCHFPDQLLARRDGVVKRLYRWPFDWCEGWSMSWSDCIVVNSNFTQGVVSKLFPGAGDLGVIYPCVVTTASEPDEISTEEKPLWSGLKVFLSVNRFERKKDIGLAIRAFHGLAEEERKGCRLVIAGGYDQRVAENVRYHEELEGLADSFGLSHATARAVPTALAIPPSIDVLFMLSVPGAFKTTLLRNATLLVYTPTNEHFGIVPVEAMSEGVPVLAANTGGPLETVLDNQTGWLRDVEDVPAWTTVMRKVLHERDDADRQACAQLGKKRAATEFSREKMAQRFDQTLTEMASTARKPFRDWRDTVQVCDIGAALFLILLTFLMRPSQYGRVLKNL